MDVCKQLAVCLGNLAWGRRESLRIASEEMGLTVGRYTHVFNRAIFDVQRRARKALTLAKKQGLCIRPFLETLEATTGLYGRLRELVTTVTEGRKWILRPQKTGVVAMLEELTKSIGGSERALAADPCGFDITLVATQETRSFTVETEREHLKDCFTDILLNSVEACNRAGRSSRQITVTCQLVTPGPILQVRFEDNGIGFDDHTLTRVNAGLPPDPDKRFGLGISLQGFKTFVENFLCGEFVARNLPQGGACVECRIPLTKEQKNGHNATSCG